MGKQFLFLPTIGVTALMFFCSGCKKEPFIADYSNAQGVVIGKEECSIDENMEYWLIDFSHIDNSVQLGDTLFLNGRTYNNVLKTKDLSPGLKKVDMQVSIDYKIISAEKILSANCGKPNPIVYYLKEIFIINQFEVR